jgi:hypothetical protein
MVPVVGVLVKLMMFVVVAAVPVVMIVVVALMVVTLGVDEIDGDKSHGYGLGAGRAGWGDDATG